jgi:Tc5 transposase DNA-binding domain
MAPNLKTQKTRGRLNDLQKKQLCEYSKKNPNAKHHEIAKEFMNKYPGLQLDRSTVSKILKNQDLYKNINEDIAENTYRHRSVKYPRLELAMTIWVQQIIAANMILSDDLLKEKGMEFARALDISEKSLSFSSGWVTKFKRRNQLRRITLHGEAASAPIQLLPEMRTQLQEILSHYHPNDIYNADETGLFYRMLPNQTLSNNKKQHGKKVVKLIKYIFFNINKIINNF